LGSLQVQGLARLDPQTRIFIWDGIWGERGRLGVKTSCTGALSLQPRADSPKPWQDMGRLEAGWHTAGDPKERADYSSRDAHTWTPKQRRVWPLREPILADAAPQEGPAHRLPER